MKGIILSGGLGSRLWPLTRVSSKQLLPVYDRPMIFHPLETLLMAGIKDILIIVAPEQAGQYLHLLGSGRNFNADFSYEVQEEPRGLADAFIIGEHFIGDDSVTMVLGDNIFEDKKQLAKEINSFSGKGGKIFAIPWDDEERVKTLGVVEFDKDMKVLSIEEKPQQPKSNYIVPGLYVFDNKVSKIAKKGKPSARGELEITDIELNYLDRGELEVGIYKGGWLDAGNFPDLLKANNAGKKMAKTSILNDVLEKYYWKKK